VIYVNGEPTLVGDDATVAKLLEGLGLSGEQRGIAIAIDGEVVPRGEWGDQVLRPLQKVEIVNAIQGG
jgi:sulfur carrier protein